MRTVTCMSDLHLEFADLKDLPGGDILLLAGDVWTIRHMRPDAQDKASRQKRDRFARFCREEISKYRRALIITGNHESYGECIDDMHGVLEHFLAFHAPNARLLANETEIIDGIAFLGTPLWATCGVGDPILEQVIGGGMNDFQLIRTSRDAVEGTRRIYRDKHREFTVWDANRLHQEAIDWLQQELPKHDKVVLMTHHAPSFMSAKGGHHHDGNLDSAYCSNLNALIEDHPQIKIAIHGHTHSEERYWIGGTHVISNPRGYFPDERCSRYFDSAAAVFDLDF